MNSKQVMGFCALAKYNNFCKAAQSIYMTQPAFSRMIQSLEEEIGLPLYHRDHVSPGLTAIGKKLLPEFQALMQHQERIRFIASQGTRSSEGAIVIASFRFGWSEDGQRTCSEFLKSHPSASIEIREHSGVSVFQALKTGEVDFIQTIYVPKDVRPMLGAVEAKTFTYMVYVSENHPFANRDHVHIKNLSSENIIIFSKESFPLMFERLMEACTHEGFVPHVTAETDSQSLLLAHVASGSEIALMPNFLKRTPGVVAVPLGHSIQEPSCWFWWKDNKKPEALEFIRFVTEWHESHKDGGLAEKA